MELPGELLVHPEICGGVASGTAPLSSQFGLRGHDCPHWQI
jgi:hypothetical protein